MSKSNYLLSLRLGPELLIARSPGTTHIEAITSIVTSQGRNVNDKHKDFVLMQLTDVEARQLAHILLKLVDVEQIVEYPTVLCHNRLPTLIETMVGSKKFIQHLVNHNLAYHLEDDPKDIYMTLKDTNTVTNQLLFTRDEVNQLRVDIPKLFHFLKDPIAYMMDYQAIITSKGGKHD